MVKKLFSILNALLVAALLTSMVLAGPGVSLSNVSFEIGSLIAKGTLTRYGNLDLLVILEASGLPVITCTNQGGNQAPGQNPPKVSAVGEKPLTGGESAKKNGKYLFGVETVNPQILNAVEYGCPNDNWVATIDFVFWTDANITILDAATEQVLLSQDYTCTTTLTSVTCTPVEG